MRKLEHQPRCWIHRCGNWEFPEQHLWPGLALPELSAFTPGFFRAIILLAFRLPLSTFTAR